MVPVSIVDGHSCVDYVSRHLDLESARMHHTHLLGSISSGKCQYHALLPRVDTPNPKAQGEVRPELMTCGRTHALALVRA